MRDPVRSNRRTTTEFDMASSETELNAARLKAAKKANVEAPTCLDQQHWLESDAIATGGALVFLMELMEKELHGFAQYHMLPCVCTSFRKQFSVIATEWSKRRRDFKPGPVSGREPFVSKWFHPLPVAERSGGEIPDESEEDEENDNVESEHRYSVHPLQTEIRVGSVVTHLELNSEHMTEQGVPPPTEGQPGFLGNEFVEMMNDLIEAGCPHLADDLFRWASQRNATKKLFVYHVTDAKSILSPFEPTRSLIFFCPLVSLETMLHPRFQMMFPISATTLARLFEKNAWALIDFSDMKQELCTWFAERNLISIVEFCKDITRQIVLCSEYRHYKVTRKRFLQLSKKYSSRFWFTDNRKFLWDLTACSDVFTHPSLMRATDSCMFAETEERVRNIVFEDDTLPTEWVPGASLFGNSIHFLPEIILDLQTDLFSEMGLTGDRELDSVQLTNADNPASVCLEFGAIFPVCVACQQITTFYKTAQTEKMSCQKICCLRKMTYANYSWDASHTFRFFDIEQRVHEQYSNHARSYVPNHIFGDD